MPGPRLQEQRLSWPALQTGQPPDALFPCRGSEPLHLASCCMAAPLIPLGLRQPVPSPPGRRPPLLVLGASPRGCPLPCASCPARWAQSPSLLRPPHLRWDRQLDRGRGPPAPAWALTLPCGPPLTPADTPLEAPAPALSLPPRECRLTLLELQSPVHATLLMPPSIAFGLNYAETKEGEGKSKRKREKTKSKISLFKSIKTLLGFRFSLH